MAELTGVRCPRCGNESRETMKLVGGEPTPDARLECIDCGFGDAVRTFEEAYEDHHY